MSASRISIPQAKVTWKRIRNHDVRMTALLVEKNPAAYARLETIRAKFPDIEIRTFKGDFVKLVPALIAAIPPKAFTFILIDPNAWDAAGDEDSMRVDSDRRCGRARLLNSLETDHACIRSIKHVCRYPR